MATNLPPLKDMEQLSPLVTRILGGNPGKFTLQGTNTYLIGTGPTRILIDTAQGLPHWRTSLSTLLTPPAPSPPITISTVLLTHHHTDHTFGVPDLLSLCPKAKVYKYPFPPSAPLPSSDHYPIPGFPETDILPIADGQVFATEGARLRAIYTPGHTTDHTCFLLEEEGALFTGDNVLGHGTAVFEDLGAYMASLEVMKGVPGFEGVAYPGHGEVVREGRGRVREYISHRRGREEEVLGVLAGGGLVGGMGGKGGGEGGRGSVSAGEIVKVVYKEVPVTLHEAAERGVLQVLGKLEREGKVRKGQGREWTVVERDGRKESL
ncbi:hypothetical protein MMC30_003781 [Trapelia coarctata]|nr:hypothetical protein [Trapelia coarctata]